MRSHETETASHACLSSTKGKAQLAHPPDGAMEKKPISYTTETHRGDSIPEPGPLGPAGVDITKWKMPVRFSALFPEHCDHYRDPRSSQDWSKTENPKK